MREFNFLILFNFNQIKNSVKKVEKLISINIQRKVASLKLLNLNEFERLSNGKAGSFENRHPIQFNSAYFL